MAINGYQEDLHVSRPHVVEDLSQNVKMFGKALHQCNVVILGLVRAVEIECQ